MTDPVTVPVRRKVGPARRALVQALNLILGPLTAGWPLAPRVLRTVTLQGMLMTWVIVPRLTPLIARLISPQSTTR